MTRCIALSAILILVTFVAYGQRKVIIDGDELYLRDSLGGNAILLSSIKRGSQNKAALWITYNRRPNVDPWIKDLRQLDENFIDYWFKKDVRILGVLITYDNCLCSKTKTMSSPDMYLIHFKILPSDWTTMKELYPDMLHDIRKID